MTFEASFADLCPSCFVHKVSTSMCPHCGYDESQKRGPLVLPHHTLLHNGQYLIGKVLGKPGGFGITYLALDTKLETKVAIKEYLPRDLAGRDGDHATISAHSADDAEHFRYGLTQFLQEARTLARFDHANIVRVRNFFEENGTGYLVMDYYDGVTLSDYLAQQPQGKLQEQTAIDILMPILDGLREVHAKNFLHRDIKPQNIYLTTGNRAILLDFGAARQAMSERSRSLSVVLSEGYAPYEQYHRRGDQGPWTDIYASAAVLYHAVAGVPPPPATERMSKDELNTRTLGVSATLANALRLGLAVDHKNRPQTMTEFQALLLTSGQPTGIVEAELIAGKVDSAISEMGYPCRADETRSSVKKVWWAVGLAVVIVTVIFFMPNRAEKNVQPVDEPAPLAPAVVKQSASAVVTQQAKGGAVTYTVENLERDDLDRTSLVATLEGKRLIGPSDEYVSIDAQKDFDGDGIMDALIHTSCGGSACGDEYQFVSIAGGRIRTASVELSTDFKIVEEGGRILINDPKGERGGATVYWSYDGQKAIKVRSVRNPLMTIDIVVACIQSNKKGCPELWDVLRDDRSFRENLALILKKSAISVTGPHATWLITGGLSFGFRLISRDGKTYLESRQCEPHFCNHHINMLLETGQRANGGNRLVAAYFTDDSIEPIWVNTPSDGEKSNLLEAECKGTPRPSACDLYSK